MGLGLAQRIKSEDEEGTRLSLHALPFSHFAFSHFPRVRVWLLGVH